MSFFGKFKLRNKLAFKSIAIALASLIFLTAIYAIYNFVKNLPTKITTYQNISLGMDMGEVMYNLGYPEAVLYKEKNSAGFLWNATKQNIADNPAGVKGFNYWEYEAKDNRIDVEFNPATHKVESIGCYVNAETFITLGTCSVNGIQALETEDMILAKLGKPSKVEINGVTKTLYYQQYNMKIDLAKRYAYYIVIANIN
jgi:hypothetical protein